MVGKKLVNQCIQQISIHACSIAQMHLLAEKSAHFYNPALITRLVCDISDLKDEQIVKNITQLALHVINSCWGQKSPQKKNVFPL